MAQEKLSKLCYSLSLASIQMELDVLFSYSPSWVSICDSLLAGFQSTPKFHLCSWYWASFSGFRKEISISAHLVPWNSCDCECTSQHRRQANILKLRESGICNEGEAGRIVNDPYSWWSKIVTPYMREIKIGCFVWFLKLGDSLVDIMLERCNNRD